MEIRNSNKKIAINTMMLYIRMLLIMVISLYTSRVILRTLGIEDFGIFNIVNGVVISFAFIQNALTSSTQRYMSYEIGGSGKNDYIKSFPTILILVLIIGVLFSVVLEPIGFLFIKYKLDIPSTRISSALILYHVSILNFFFLFIRIPYNSAIIACEKMGFYAYLSIVESLLKLGAVYLLVVSVVDKLVMYGIVMLVITLIVNVVYIAYSRVKIKGCTITRNIDLDYMKSILSFSGWSLYEGMTNIAKTESVGFILNIYCGVAINAAVGIAKQVNSTVMSFISNFQTAFKPQLTMQYASGNYYNLYSIVYNTSRLSGLILLLIIIPVIYNIEYILHAWLGIVPDYTIPFVICFLITSLFEALGGPLWITGYAIGDIKFLQLVTGTIRLINIPIAIALMHYNINPAGVFISQIILDAVVFIYRLVYLKIRIGFSVSRYMKKVVIPVYGCALFVYVILYLMQLSNNSFQDLCLSVFVSSALLMCAAFFMCLSIEERKQIVLRIKSVIYKNES